ncbi:MAG: helix-turn-helix transcriptional regulator [Trueperella sp.]|nr:helix-turn-helix transcriptional regulator [Trueperella sp.]
MITVQLDQILEKRGITLAELSRRIDITPVNLSILKNGHAKAIRFTTLAAICAELECQPGDILRFTPTSTADD